MANRTLCVDCLHFKVCEVSLRKAREPRFRGHKRLLKKLRTKVKMVRVFYCRRGYTKHLLYIENRTVPKMLVRGCRAVESMDG